MTTRSIVTSQPDVACDVCARRLLRGEQPEHFVVAGRRRIVCELCAPRAAQEGWLRESDPAAPTLPPMRPRRGRSLFDRILQVARPAAATPEATSPTEASERSSPFDMYEGNGVPEPPPADPETVAEGGFEEQPPARAAGGRGATYVEQAIEVFNTSEYPRRVAGLTRSLGAPEVTVRSAEHLDSVVRIVVAWELSWYRYEVDLSEGQAGVEPAGQGSELAELDRDERAPNAAALESGALALTQ
ncbi:MAG: hypothetical protein ACLQBB_14410 [Solirubrobacteraceae bacterium]